MLPIREMVESALKRLAIRSNISPKDPDVSILVSIGELYLSASEKMPEKRNNTADNQHKGDLGQEYADSGFNEAIDACTPLIMRLQGRVEELEARGK